MNDNRLATEHKKLQLIVAIEERYKVRLFEAIKSVTSVEPFELGKYTSVC